MFSRLGPPIFVATVIFYTSDMPKLRISLCVHNESFLMKTIIIISNPDKEHAFCD